MDEERTGEDDRPPATDTGAPAETTTIDVDDSGGEPPIEPESVDPEHAVFVVLGAALTVAVIAGIV